MLQSSCNSGIATAEETGNAIPTSIPTNFIMTASSDHMVLLESSPPAEALNPPPSGLKGRNAKTQGQAQSWAHRKARIGLNALKQGG